MLDLNKLSKIAKIATDNQHNFYDKKKVDAEKKEDPKDGVKKVEVETENGKEENGNGNGNGNNFPPNQKQPMQQPAEPQQPAQGTSAIVTPQDPATMNLVQQFSQNITPDILQAAAQGNSDAILAIIDVSSQLAAGGVDQAAQQSQMQPQAQPQMNGMQPQQFQPAPNPTNNLPPNEENPREITDGSNAYHYANPVSIESQIAENEIARPEIGAPVNSEVPPKAPTTQAVQPDGDAVNVRPMAPISDAEKIEKAKRGLMQVMELIQ